MAIEWGEAVSKYGAEVDIDELLSDLRDNEEWAGKNGNLELQDNLQNAIMVIAAMRYELDKRWIPCSERMPETTEKGLGVLYSDCSLVVSSKTGWVAMAYYLTDGEKSWWEFADAQNKPKIDWDEVTHWMPLPEPPKEMNNVD